jgi:hypothetical protein
MQVEEHYLVEHVGADGKVDVEKYIVRNAALWALVVAIAVTFWVLVYFAVRSWF